MKFSIETDLNNCEKLWKLLSPDTYICDSWDYRLCFNRAYGNDPYFIVGYEGKKLIGCIPLEYDHQYKEYIFFGGGDWNEHLRFLIKDEYKEKYLDEFLTRVPEKADLINIDRVEAPFSTSLIPLEPTFFLVPHEYNFDIQAYLASWSKKRRKNVRYDIRQVEKLQPSIVTDRLEDIGELMNLNRDQYKHESAFTDIWFIKALKQLITDTRIRPFLHTKTILITDKICAVALYTIYKNDYTFLAVGVSTEIPNIFKYLTMKLIEEAFLEKARRIDFLADECGWKEGWRLKSEMLYHFASGVAATPAKPKIPSTNRLPM